MLRRDLNRRLGVTVAAPIHTRSDVPQPALSSTLSVAGGAAVLGLAADLLFRHADAGLNVFVWIAGLAAWATYLAQHHSLVRPSPDYWQLPAVLFAAFFALRVDPGLRALNLLAILAALALPLLRARGESLWRAGLFAYVRAGTNLAAHAALGALLLVFKDMEWTEVSRLKGGAPLKRTLLGLVLAAPVVIVFAAIFSSADPVFGAAITRLFEADLEPMVEHAVVIGVFGALAAGYLRARLWGARDFDPSAVIPPLSLRLPWTPLAMMAGSMTAMFLLFVAVQARAMFGGADFLASEAGLTVAEYARRGFFECVAACGLSLPVLLAADTLVDRDEPGAVRSLRALTTMQLVLIGVVLASAVARLQLYTAAFGLTHDRVLGAAALAWLGLTTGWFGWSVLRGRRANFAFGAVAGGFGVLAALNLANPEAIVARVNIARAERGAELDVGYLYRLGADATPTIAAALPRIPAQSCALLEHLFDRQTRQRPRDWRSFTLAHYRADRAIVTAMSRSRPCGEQVPA
jgi:hypothetical protein